jgi:hypothetical protein
MVFFFFFFFVVLGFELKATPCPFLVMGFFEIGLMNYLARLTPNRNPLISTS